MALPLLPTLGLPEILVILVVVVVLFGTGKLPDVARQLGKGMKQYQKAKRQVDSVLEPDLDALLKDDVEDAVEVKPPERDDP